MTKPRRIATCAALICVAWLVALLVLDPIFETRTRGRVADRLADSLQSQVTIESADLALVRGRLALDDLKVRRDDLIGHLAIDVVSVRCELPPLGIALVDRDCSELGVRGMHLEVSSAALFRLTRPKRPPFRARHVVIDDARLGFAPSAFLPSLGRVAIQIDHAESDATVFKTPLSWIFALRELRATVELPANITIRLEYAAGVLRASGGVFGETPVELPLALPVAEASDDAHAEITKLVALGKDLAEELVTRKAQDWLKSKL